MIFHYQKHTVLNYQQVYFFCLIRPPIAQQIKIFPLFQKLSNEKAHLLNLNLFKTPSTGNQPGPVTQRAVHIPISPTSQHPSTSPTCWHFTTHSINNKARLAASYVCTGLAMANLRQLRNDYIRFSLLFPPKKRSFVFSFFFFYTITNEDVRSASFSQIFGTSLFVLPSILKKLG